MNVAKFAFEYVGHIVDHTQEIDGEPVVTLKFRPRTDTKGSFQWKGKESEMFEVLHQLKINATEKDIPVDLILQTVQRKMDEFMGGDDTEP